MLLRYDGDYEVIPLYYPVSMDANVSDSFFKTLVNQYKQQGAGDTALKIFLFSFRFLENKKSVGAKN